MRRHGVVRHVAKPRELACGQALRVDSEQMAQRCKAGWLRKRSKPLYRIRFAIGFVHGSSGKN